MLLSLALRVDSSYFDSQGSLWATVEITDASFPGNVTVSVGSEVQPTPGNQLVSSCVLVIDVYHPCTSSGSLWKEMSLASVSMIALMCVQTPGAPCCPYFSQANLVCAGLAVGPDLITAAGGGEELPYILSYHGSCPCECWALHLGSALS